MTRFDDRPCVRPLTCPVCQTPLALAGQTLTCVHNHAFDVAREGYVNLILGHKRPKILGDDKMMLRARRRFMEKGYYAALSNHINQIALAHLDGVRGEETAVLDTGCGEGYVIGQLQRCLPRHFCTFGLDVAKEATRLAAKRYPAVRFIVADLNGRLPFPNQSAHLLLNIFAPRNPAEFARVAVPGALLLIVIPQPNHLGSLRADLGLLDIEPDKQQRITDQLARLFTLQRTQSLTIPLDLRQPDLTDLVQMTPNYWHPTPERQAKLQAMTWFLTTAQFEILSFLKNP